MIFLLPIILALDTIIYAISWRRLIVASNLSVIYSEGLSD